MDIFADKAYADATWAERLWERNVRLFTPVKLKKGQMFLDSADSYFSQAEKVWNVHILLLRKHEDFVVYYRWRLLGIARWREKVNCVPRPLALRTVMVCSCSSMMRLTIERPRPEPTAGVGVCAFSTL